MADLRNFLLKGIQGFSEIKLSIVSLGGMEVLLSSVAEGLSRLDVESLRDKILEIL